MGHFKMKKFTSSHAITKRKIENKQITLTIRSILKNI